MPHTFQSAVNVPFYSNFCPTFFLLSYFYPSFVNIELVFFSYFFTCCAIMVDNCSKIKLIAIQFLICCLVHDTYGLGIWIKIIILSLLFKAILGSAWKSGMFIAETLYVASSYFILHNTLSFLCRHSEDVCQRQHAAVRLGEQLRRGWSRLRKVRCGSV